MSVRSYQRVLALVGIGPQRTGTTWLYECLRQHPSICFPVGVKETLFWDYHFERGMKWYWGQFPEPRKDREVLFAEMGSTYFDSTDAAARLYAHNPDCKIIVSLRDPVSRAFSLYLNHRQKGQVRDGFMESTQKIPRILETSRYSRYLPHWIKLFGDKNIVVVLQDDMSLKPESLLVKLYQFVGLTPAAIPSSARGKVNEASLPRYQVVGMLAAVIVDWFREKGWHAPVELGRRVGLKRLAYSGSQAPLPTLDAETRRRLVEEFEPDIAYVEKLLKRSLTHWRAV